LEEHICAAQIREVRVAGRECEDYGRLSIRGNHMNLGGQSALDFPMARVRLSLTRRFRPKAP
jgi:hypothetical protein